MEPTCHPAACRLSTRHTNKRNWPVQRTPLGCTLRLLTKRTNGHFLAISRQNRKKYLLSKETCLDTHQNGARECDGDDGKQLLMVCSLERVLLFDRKTRILSLKRQGPPRLSSGIRPLQGSRTDLTDLSEYAEPSIELLAINSEPARERHPASAPSRSTTWIRNCSYERDIP